MAKAILILDMPENCSQCKLIFHTYSNIGTQSHCPFVVLSWESKDTPHISRPHSCPLKSMPKRHPVETEHHSGRITINDVLDATKEGFFKGYNYCIDCLEGKENE